MYREPQRDTKKKRAVLSICGCCCVGGTRDEAQRLIIGQSLYSMILTTVIFHKYCYKRLLINTDKAGFMSTVYLQLVQGWITNCPGALVHVIWV